MAAAPRRSKAPRKPEEQDPAERQTSDAKAADRFRRGPEQPEQNCHQARFDRPDIGVDHQADPAKGRINGKRRRLRLPDGDQKKRFVALHAGRIVGDGIARERRDQRRRRKNKFQLPAFLISIATRSAARITRRKFSP